MRKRNKLISLVDDAVSAAVKQGVVHLELDEVPLNGRMIKVAGQHLINFGSCSYLGLEHDQRLKSGAINAINRYGTQFSASRAYLSAPLYQRLEAMLSELFAAPTLIAPSTTLGHQAALPVLVGDEDLIIVDQQVHASVQTAADRLKVRRVPVVMLRHSDIDGLTELLGSNQYKYDRIWYLADGVYSMYGDKLPLACINQLLAAFKTFHVYIDDAHGVSWSGTCGRGSVLGQQAIHERMLVAISLNKSFACGGGAIVFPNEEWKRQVRTCGGPMIFSGPLQPGTLGALVESVKIHQSGEVHELQRELKAKIRLFNELVAHYHLNLVSKSDVPIRFIKLGRNEYVYSMVEALKSRGFYVNTGTFPAVPMKEGGLRCAINRTLKEQDIRTLIEAIAELIPIVCDQGRTSSRTRGEKKSASSGTSLTLDHQNAIEKMNKTTWNELFHDKGSFTWEGLQSLEDIFSNNLEKENNWKFHYLTVCDQSDTVVLAAFLTELWWKEDMLAHEAISRVIAQKRQDDPYYLTSKTLMLGSLLTEGDHLYLNREHPHATKALDLFVEEVWKIQAQTKIKNIVLRDFSQHDQSLGEYFHNKGFVKLGLPQSHIIEPLRGSHGEAYLEHIRSKKRNWIKRTVQKEAMFRCQIYDATSKPNASQLREMFDLYKQVALDSYEISTFLLPSHIFESILEVSNWEIIALYLKENDINVKQEKLVTAGAAFKTESSYCPIFLGLDYHYVVSHGVYRQLMWQCIKRAEALNKQRIFFGYGASLEKIKFGAQVQEKCAYVQFDDTYAQDLISNMPIPSERHKKKWQIQ